jgi:CheY-like chemotaxis protein
LRDCDAEVTEVSSVDEALAAIAQRSPDMMLSDIGMAGRDGYELIRHIRALGHTPTTLPAIALTAFARLEDRQDALLAGYQVHLAKPIDPQELLAAVALLAGRTDAEPIR